MSRMLSLFSRGNAFAEALRILGDEHLANDRFRLARRNYSAALRVEPRNPALWMRQAEAWEDDPYGSDDRAARCYRRAVRLDPHDATAWAKLGRAAARTQRNKLAMKAIARALAIAPADAKVLTIAADVYRSLGKIQSAWRSICQARFLAPRDGHIRRLWEQVCYRRAVKNSKPQSRATIPFLRINGWRWDAPHAC